MNDEELKARLHASDPAASLKPAAPHEVARLLEDVMATELTTESRQTGTRNRGPLTWLVAAAAVLVIAGAGIFGVRALTGDDPTPTAGDPAPSATQLEVSAPAGSAKCMVPNAETLASVDVAVDATVTAVDSDRVTLEPSQWYAGDPTDVVEITAPGDRPTDAGLGFQFSAGDRYLVAARNGQVAVCGFSAPYNDGLAAIYAEAFPT
jgi:hypothetical protein